MLEKGVENTDSSEGSSSSVDIEESEGLLTSSYNTNQSRRRSRYLWSSIHISLVTIYTILFIWLTARSSTSSTCQPLLYSPANGAIHRTTKLVDGFQKDSIYAGYPNDKSDAAWHELLANINLRISQEELAKLNQTSIALKDGGYLGTLGVYHELHCVKRLRKWYYRDHYYPNITAEIEDELSFHAGHCIELIRQATICRGDTTITSFEFRGASTRPAVKNGYLHECVAWEPLRDWAGTRRVDLWDTDNLIHDDSQNNSNNENNTNQSIT